MCGIVGVLAANGQILKSNFLKTMCDSISHRGPDDAGYLVARTGPLAGKMSSYDLEFTDSEFSSISPRLPVIDSPEGRTALQGDHWNLFLGHRRLSILDLSAAAHQPMQDRSGNFWLVFNGEIYNHIKLRQELEGFGYEFRSRSDTEVVLLAYMEWGIDCVKRFNGMFAFALFDSPKQTLYLARDRYGIKPLYYAQCGDLFLFASEIKSLLCYPDLARKLNYEALNEYFTFQNLFQFETLFEGVFLLPPANIAQIDFQNRFQKTCFWDYDFTQSDENISFSEASEETLRLFHQAVKRQCVADVPIGSYLSGGIDSGAVVAVASQQLERMSTFTAGFELSQVTGVEASFDERLAAEIVANEFKTQHFEQVINAGDISWALPKVIWHMEDLRVGMSYPNYYISKLASKFVTIVLTGVGGDELYAGYPWRYYRELNPTDREEFYSHYYGFWQRLVKGQDRLRLFKPETLKNISIDRPYEIFKKVFRFNENLNYDSPEDHLANSLYFEIKTFLHGLFIVGDKLSMASSIEERFPFLDNDLVDFAMKIPIRHKIRNLEQQTRMDENILRKQSAYYQSHDDGKNVLRHAMQGLLPERITRRSKQGFSAPDESWYRGENFQYVKDRLLAKSAVCLEFLNKDFIEKTIKEHSQGINHRLLIWSLLSFEEWYHSFFMSKPKHDS